MSGRNAERGQQVVGEIESTGGKAEFLSSDLHDAESARLLAAEAVTRLGHIDVLVNNAGVYPFGPTESMTEEDFTAVFNLNVRVPFFLVAELAPKMAERGNGVIVNVTTMVAEYGNVGTSLYGASKAAVVSLTKTWAAEYGPRAYGSTRSVQDRHSPKAPQLWVRGFAGWLALLPRAVPRRLKKSPTRLCSWRATKPATSTGSPSL
ncbi:short chain dehydrogenase family protein [Mycobacterium kansasii]|uniref:Short chain dehydrogenase family protein n=1 Tax=Mycobacterium kansasii TaxID=1768 RepID=A0A1V3XCX1_MYCKA|nr:short chain dehydrogenase family protein [Mycobacterium kansasii]